MPPRDPPRRKSHRDGGGGYGSGENANPTISSFDSTSEREDDLLDQAPTSLSNNFLRGGASSEAIGIVAGAASYWKGALLSLTSTVLGSYQRLARKRNRKPEHDTKQTEIQKLLDSTLVQRVTVPNSTVLPIDVIQAAAHQSILGKPLKPEPLQELVKRLNHWYREHGFLFHMVTGATLKPESATAELTVQEPCFAKDPIGISFYKEMIPDPSTQELLSKQQYQRRYGSSMENWTNRTLVPTQGHVQPHRIAQVMKMKAGEPFCFDPIRWDRVVSSGLFSSVLHASPILMPDGTLQFHIAAQEAPTKQLEYGIGRSLYTGGWEGEMDFRHGNILGGGETLQLNVRKATEDGRSNSVRVSFNEGRLSGGDGYHLEAFSEYYQDRGDTLTPCFRQRQGASIQVHTLVPKSTLTQSLERNANTADGPHEVVSSSTLNVGPYVGQLPSNIRANVDASVTLGVRIGPASRIPYATASATTRQLIPIGKKILLALKHTGVASTQHLPHHVSRTIGATNKIRGSPTSPTSIQNAVKGSTEVRIPVPLPQWIKERDDANVVLFVDYLLTGTPSTQEKKWTSGIGFRKSIQGIPLQCDLVLTSSGRFRPILGIGSDFVF